MTHVLVMAPGDRVVLHLATAGRPADDVRDAAEPLDASVVTIGDRIRFSVDLLKDFYDQPRHRTVIVELAHVVRDADGTVTLWLNAADRQDPP